MQKKKKKIEVVNTFFLPTWQKLHSFNALKLFYFEIE